MNCETGFLHSIGLRWAPGVYEDPRGARHWVHFRVTDLYAVGSVNPDHDAVMRIGGEAPGGGPILSVGIKCQVRIRLPTTSDRQFGSRAESSASAENGAKWVCSFGSSSFQEAGRKTTPSSGSPVVTKRQSAMISLRPARQSLSCACHYGYR